MDPLLLVVILAFVLALASSSSYSPPPAKPPPRAQPKDTIILFVTGRIKDPNIKNLDPSIQDLFEKDNLAFSQAVAYDRERLLKLKQHQAPSAAAEGAAYYGPLLADVLTDAGAETELLHLRNLLGVSRTMTKKELEARPWILALNRGEAPLMLGGNGPLLLLHAPPAGETTFSADDEKAWMPALYYIDAR
jgi:hypothetical protein